MPGEWTYDDYLRLPDDEHRYEIIFGVLYMTNTPDIAHQVTVAKLVSALSAFAEVNSLGTVLPAPVEVRLAGIADPVQPDVFFISKTRHDIIQAKFINGAPDLVIEVLSPSTARRDYGVKMDAYERAGVREYWIAAPQSKSVQVYILVSGEFSLRGAYSATDLIASEVLSGIQLAANALFAH